MKKLFWWKPRRAVAISVAFSILAVLSVNCLLADSESDQTKAISLRAPREGAPPEGCDPCNPGGAVIVPTGGGGCDCCAGIEKLYKVICIIRQLIGDCCVEVHCPDDFPANECEVNELDPCFSIFKWLKVIYLTLNNEVEPPCYEVRSKGKVKRSNDDLWKCYSIVKGKK